MQVNLWSSVQSAISTNCFLSARDTSQNRVSTCLWYGKESKNPAICSMGRSVATHAPACPTYTILLSSIIDRCKFKHAHRDLAPSLSQDPFEVASPACSAFSLAAAAAAAAADQVLPVALPGHCLACSQRRMRRGWVVTQSPVRPALLGCLKAWPPSQVAGLHAGSACL